MLVIPDTWVLRGNVDLRDLQGNRAKTESKAKQEILEKWDSPDQQGLEDFLGHQGLLA